MARGDAAGSFVSSTRREVLRTAGVGILSTALPAAAAHASDPLVPVGGTSLLVELDAGVTASYPGTGTTWTDLSGSGNSATLSGSPVPVASADGGGSLDLAGGTASGSFASITSSSSLDRLTSAGTFEFWLQLDSVVPSSPNMLLSKRSTVSDGYVAFVTTTGWTFRFGTSSASSLTLAATPETGVWRQIVFVVGSSGGRIHVNGAVGGPVVSTVPSYTGDASNTVTAAALDLFNVNPRPQTGPVTLDGRVAIVRIYATDLTAAQVAQNYEAERDRFGLPALPAL
jgi:hypothetical protein